LLAARVPAFTGTRIRLNRAVSQLHALSPLRVLQRGYALVYGPTGQLLRDASEAIPGTRITARVARGTIQADVAAEE
jgi:exodeoxyribonuclease VII large subunit